MSVTVNHKQREPLTAGLKRSENKPSDEWQVLHETLVGSDGAASLFVTFSAKDQGKGDRKGKVALKINGAIKNLHNDVLPHDWTTIEVEVPGPFEHSTVVQVVGVVGSGKGHELHLDNLCIYPGEPSNTAGAAKAASSSKEAQQKPSSSSAAAPGSPKKKAAAPKEQEEPPFVPQSVIQISSVEELNNHLLPDRPRELSEKEEIAALNAKAIYGNAEPRVNKKAELIVLQFSASWCEVCKLVAEPAISQWAAAEAFSKRVTFLQCDENATELIKNFSVEWFPTTVLLAPGRGPKAAPSQVSVIATANPKEVESQMITHLKGGAASQQQHQNSQR